MATIIFRCTVSCRSRRDDCRVCLPRPVRHGRRERCFTSAGEPPLRSVSSFRDSPPFGMEESLSFHSAPALVLKNSLAPARVATSAVHCCVKSRPTLQWNLCASWGALSHDSVRCIDEASQGCRSVGAVPVRPIFSVFAQKSRFQIQTPGKPLVFRDVSGRNPCGPPTLEPPGAGDDPRVEISLCNATGTGSARAVPSPRSTPGIANSTAIPTSLAAISGRRSVSRKPRTWWT